MGNAQSAGHHNRLSKPKTNTNSPFGSPKVDSPVLVDNDHADFSVPDREYLKARLTSPMETEFSFSAHADEKLGQLASHVQRRLSTLSRSNTVASRKTRARDSNAALASLPGSKLSLDSQPQSVDLATAIKLLQEVSKTASPEDLAALQQALQPPSRTPSPPPIQAKRKSIVNRSSSSLLRRRSLLATPGLATRSSPTNGTRKSWRSWKSPEPEPEPEHLDLKWKVEMMGTSPLARLASLDGRESPAPRAQTPGDLDYSHLGSLKLGSLVVTNGPASPAFSAKKLAYRKSHADVSQEEEYFAASDGSASPIMWREAKNSAHSRSKSSVLPSKPEVRYESQSKVNTGSPCNSPLKNDQQAEGGFNELHKSALSQSAETLAKSYMVDLPNSPFRPSFDRATRKDEGYVEGDASFRGDAFRIRDGTVLSGSAALFEQLRYSPDSARSSEEPQEKRKANTRSGRPLPRKADSGYSSGGSTRIVHSVSGRTSNESSVQGISPVVSDMLEAEQRPSTSGATSLYTFEQMLALPISKPLPPIPNDDEEIKSPNPNVPKLLTVSTATPVEASPISPRTMMSVASNWTLDSSASAMSNRLRKRRPSAPDLPQVHTCKPVEAGTIPRIPSPVRTQFVRRMSGAPEMECLTRTYLAKEYEAAEEAVLDSPLISIEFPSPSSSPVEQSRHHKRSHTERPPTPPVQKSRRSLSLFRKKSEKTVHSKATNKPPALSIMDLGTDASALGSSPYDAAMSKSPRQAIASPTHPHQLGNAMRAKPAAPMNDEAAAQYARLRSRDRNMQRPEMPRRPSTYHESDTDSLMVRPTRSRPHSTYSETPEWPLVNDSDLHHDQNAARGRRQEQKPSLHHDEDVSSQPSIRARSTGRGPVVSQLIDRYDQWGQRLPSSAPPPAPSTNRVPRPAQPEWEAHAKLWSQRRKSMGENLRQYQNQGQDQDQKLKLKLSHRKSLGEGLRHRETQYSTVQMQHATPQKSDMALYDRYSGGLHYGYEGRGYGVGGSAGTRQLHSAASRKSMITSHQFGIDLSDVPVFLQRVGHTN